MGCRRASSRQMGAPGFDNAGGLALRAEAALAAGSAPLAPRLPGVRAGLQLELADCLAQVVGQFDQFGAGAGRGQGLLYGLLGDVADAHY